MIWTYPDRLFLKGVKYIGWKSRFRERIRDSGKFVQNIYHPCYKIYIIFILKLFRFMIPSRYTDAEPFKRLYVDPKNIVFEIDGSFRHRGWVVDGNWDTNCNRIDSSDLYVCLKRRFIHGMSWQESGYIDFAREEIRSQYGNAWGLKSENEIEHRCKVLDSVWSSMKTEGYKSQTTLIKENPNSTYKQNIDSIHPELNEIGVDIGRDGQFLWNRVGHHRLIMAKLLDVDAVPVFVHRRHKQWQQTRDGISQKPTAPPDSHPDLIDLTE
jgi:hypothetical protein